MGSRTASLGYSASVAELFAQDTPHMRVIVDDQEAQLVEINADHDAIRSQLLLGCAEGTEAA